jgi:hypothetical protein
MNINYSIQLTDGDYTVTYKYPNDTDPLYCT